MTPNQFIKQHNLGSGRIIGSHLREFTPLETPELVAALRTEGWNFSFEKACNSCHTDFGKPILVLTLKVDEF